MQESLAELLRAGKLDQAWELLQDAEPQEIGRILSELEPPDRRTLFQSLPPAVAAEVYGSGEAGTLWNDPELTPPFLTANIVEALLRSRQFQALDRLLADTHPVDTARLLARLPDDEAAVAFRLLPKDTAVLVFEQMEPEEQQRVLHSFTDERTRELLDAMSPDDRTRLLDEVPAGVTHRLIQLLSPAERTSALVLLGYPERSAGRLMTPDVVDLRSGMTVSRAMERIRQQAKDKETIYEDYVTDDGRRLLGVISLKDLVLADPGTVVDEIMSENPKSVGTHADQEEVAAILRDYDLLAVPVVDNENRLVGVITHDDVMDVVEAEATEDIYLYGAVATAEQSYFRSNPFVRSRRRLAWLFLLLVVNTVTGTFIASQEEMLGTIVILAAFIPLLIGTGGNIGAQSSTIVVRGLATGELEPRRAALTIGNEIVVGALLGIVLGVLAYAWAYMLGGRNAEVAMVVSVTLSGIAIMATLVGAGLPFLFRRVSVDPAVASAPLVTTVMDIFGVLLYFLIAHTLLSF